MELRHQFATLILQGAPVNSWTTKNSQSLHHFKTRIDAARTLCTDNSRLPPRPTPHRKGSNWGRWQEAGLDILEYCTTRWPDAQIALQLSSIHPTSCDALPVLDTHETRLLHETLSTGTVEAIGTIQQRGHDHLIMWAPLTSIPCCAP